MLKLSKINFGLKPTSVGTAPQEEEEASGQQQEERLAKMVERENWKRRLCSFIFLRGQCIYRTTESENLFYFLEGALDQIATARWDSWSKKRKQSYIDIFLVVQSPSSLSASHLLCCCPSQASLFCGPQFPWLDVSTTLSQKTFCWLWLLCFILDSKPPCMGSLECIERLVCR